MHDETLRRVALNDALFRDQRDHGASQPAENRKTEVLFHCECARLDCSATVQLPLSHYDWVRKHPGRYILLEDHVTPDADEIVFGTNRYVVAEKKDAAGGARGHSPTSMTWGQR